MNQWLAVGGILGWAVYNDYVTLPQLIGLSVSATSVALYALYHYQDHLLYQPKIHPQFLTPQQNPAGYRDPSESGIPFEDVYIVTPDNIRLHGWLLRPDDLIARRARPTLLFFHANAGNMGFRLDNLKLMYNALEVNIFILSYRGYGNSEGAPSEDGIIIDATTTWKYITHNRDDIDTSRLFIFGRSLGGSVAIALASLADVRSRICGMILENTFTSIGDLVDTLFPILAPLKGILLTLKWPALDRIRLVTAPILFVSGSVDEVVPPSHMNKLFQAATLSEDATMHVVPTGSHNNTWSEGGAAYIEAMKDFIDKHSKLPTRVSRAPKIQTMNASTGADVAASTETTDQLRQRALASQRNAL